MTRHNVNAALEADSSVHHSAAPSEQTPDGLQPREHVVVTRSLITPRGARTVAEAGRTAPPVSQPRRRLSTLHGLPRTLLSESPEEAIAAANREFEDAVGRATELPIAVLIKQRNEALTYQVESAQALHKVSRALTTVREESARQCATLRRQLQLAWEELERLRQASADGETIPQQTAHARELQTALEEAQREIEETRAEAARLQDERDEAIRETDDVRFELYSQLEAARDESIELQARVDELQRSLDDSSDEAQVALASLEAELNDARQQLQWQEAEMAQLKRRVAPSATTTPLPSDAARSLEPPQGFAQPATSRH